MQRKLTVIVSADVVGYSALMERDESGTLDPIREDSRYKALVAKAEARLAASNS